MSLAITDLLLRSGLILVLILHEAMPLRIENFLGSNTLPGTISDDLVLAQVFVYLTAESSLFGLIEAACCLGGTLVLCDGISVRKNPPDTFLVAALGEIHMVMVIDANDAWKMF